MRRRTTTLRTSGHLGQDHAAVGVEHAVGDGLGREPAEDDRVDRPNARAGQHRDRDLGRHAHVDGDAVTLLDAEGAQHIGAAGGFVAELGEGQGAGFAWLALPDERRARAPAGFDVAVQAVVA